MFERILVPLDGSTRAAHAIPIAACIAEDTHGTVILVSVVNHFILSQHPQMDRNNKIWAADDSLSISEAEEYLDKMACSPELAHVAVEKAILSGPIASTLLSTATSCRADLIVLSSHGCSGMMSKMFGSVSEKVVGWATIPVLVLRENGPPLLLQYPQTDRSNGHESLPPHVLSNMSNR